MFFILKFENENILNLKFLHNHDVIVKCTKINIRKAMTAFFPLHPMKMSIKQHFEQETTCHVHGHRK